MNSDTSLHVAVPTATLIISKADDPSRVVVLQSNGKFGDKLLLPGGKVKFSSDSSAETAVKEAGEEVGISDIAGTLKLFCVCSKPRRDLRHVSLNKFLDGNERPEGISEDMPFTTHHCCDTVYLATTRQEPRADGDEAKKVLWIDVDDLNSESFALDHGRLLIAYKNFLENGTLPGVNDF